MYEKVYATVYNPLDYKMRERNDVNTGSTNASIDPGNSILSFLCVLHFQWHDGKY